MISMGLKGRGLHDAGDVIRRIKGFDQPRFVRQRGRVLTQDLLRWAPPRGKSPGSESWPSMKRRGEKEVERDGKKLFRAIDEIDVVRNAMSSPDWGGMLGEIKRLVVSFKYAELERLLFKIGIQYSGIIPEATEDLWNQAVAIGTRGHPARHKRYGVVNAASIKRLINKRKRHVGLLKAGWGAAASALGVPARNWPAWVRRHGFRGQFEDRADHATKPTVRLINDTRPAKDMSQSEIVDAAIRVNRSKMVIEAREMLNNWKKKAGFK